MYADDTVVLAESKDEMQKSLNTLHEYCEEWKLKINVTKTKIMIFSRGKIRNLPDLMFGNTKIEVVFEYNYLGIILNYNGNFTKAIKSLYDKGSKAIFSLLRKARSLQLPINLQLHLFDKVVTPVILYGCEVWGFESCKILDKLQLKFCKYILKLNKSTCFNMIYGELGVILISVQAKCRLLIFWAKLVDGTEGKLSNIFHYLLYKMDEPVFFTSNRIRFVKSNLNALGFFELYTTQNIPYSSNCFKNRVQLRTKDKFRQNWASEVFDSSKCFNYRMFKTNFEYENYLTILEDSQRIVFTKFRCRNHKLPIETGSHNNIPRELRICQKCNGNSIGDEFHYLFVCTFFRQHRHHLIAAKFYNNPSMLTFNALLSSHDAHVLGNVCTFIKIIFDEFSQ